MLGGFVEAHDWEVDEQDARLRSPGIGPRPILAGVSDDFIDPLEWGLANAANARYFRAVNMRAERRIRKSGRFQCGLRVIDGSQPGLSGRWQTPSATLEWALHP